MFSGRDLVRKAVVVHVLLMALLIVGCAAKKDLTRGPEGDLMLKYSLAEGDVLKYRLTSSFVQTVEVMGDKAEVTAEDTREFSIKSEGMDDGNMNLLVTMDAMEVDIKTPQGDLETDASEVIGKSFEMTLSPTGEELDISGADVIEYDMGPQGKRSIESHFSAFFPDLPGKSAAMNDSWSSTSEITEETASGDLTITIETNNTLAGFETIQGLECAKITAPFTGTLSGLGSEQDVMLLTDAKIKGTSTWYFAYKEGIFVKEISKGTAEGTITAMTPLSYDFPLNRAFKIEVTLLE